MLIDRSQKLALSLFAGGVLILGMSGDALAQRRDGDSKQKQPAQKADTKQVQRSPNQGQIRQSTERRQVQQQPQQPVRQAPVQPVRQAPIRQVNGNQQIRVQQDQQQQQIRQANTHRQIQNQQIQQQQQTIRQSNHRPVYQNPAAQGDGINNHGHYQAYDHVRQQQLQRERVSLYNQRWSNWQNLQQDRDRRLQQERRLTYLRYQDRYWQQIQRDRLRLQQARFYDNYYDNYRYSRGGSYYYTSQYGAQMLRNAVNNGYEQGFYAGQADRNDHWNYDYQNSFGFQDGAYGYDSYAVTLDEYNYYFRQGFQRGYEDGYYGRNQYGSYSNGKYEILGAAIGTILDIATY